MKKPVKFLVSFLFLILISCDPNMVYDEYVHMEDGIWKWTDAREFRADITDTISLHNIYLQIRHSVEYPMSNLYMFVHVKGPTGQILTDTINMILAAPDGRWNGSGTGKLRELQLLYRSQAQFGKSGTYVFTIEQGMRNPELPVTDLGVRIERSNP